MEVAPAGDRAALVTLGDVTAAELHAAAARVRSLAGVLAVIPGHSSLYVIGRQTIPGNLLDDLTTGRLDDSPPRTIRVHFNGEDFEEFLARTGMNREAFEARVATLRLTARYLGFRGGFAYLDGWPEEWAMPRRPTSRPLVARGSFAIAGAVAAFYPIDSPGGWNLLGRTDQDLEHSLVPGDVILVEPSRDPLSPPAKVKKTALELEGVEVLAAPLATLVTAPDWTRVARGLPPGGPFDDVAAALANRAAGNAPDAALVECAMAGPRFRFTRGRVVAWCGPDLGVRVQRVRAGEEIAFGKIEGGLRAYLALGESEGVVARVARGERHEIQVMRGPHDIGLDELTCEVTPSLDRVGIRMRPLQPIDAKIPADLRSIGMQCGTVQLHPDGSIVAMGPDHPVTGGYLQPMTLLSGERWKLAQLRPGDRVRFYSPY